MSSDSSEEENLELLIEAANNEFFSPNLYDPNCEKNTVQVNGSTSKQSLRYQHEDKPVLDISPEFQRFISTQLMKFIDSQIKEVNALSRCQSNSEDQGGIRLFTTSTNLVSCDETIDSMSSETRKVKRRKISKKNTEDIPKKQKCKAAAVSAEWVLSQEAIDGWEPCAKGKLEILTGDEVEVRSIQIQRVNKELTNKTSLSTEEKKEKKKLKRQKSREKLKKLKHKYKEEVMKESVHKKDEKVDT